MPVMILTVYALVFCIIRIENPHAESPETDNQTRDIGTNTTRKVTAAHSNRTD